MKKVFLALLCAGLFFACGNKKEQATTLADSNNVATIEAPVDTLVEEEPAAEPQEAVAETPSKKTNTTPSKKTNNSGMTSTKNNETQSVKEHAESAGNRIANKAIDKAESEATSTIVNSGKKKR